MTMQWIDTFQWSWRVRAWLTIFGPLVGSVVALAWAANYGIHASTIALTIMLYIGTMLGLSLGYHRFFTHRGYECHRAVKCSLAVLGCAAAQGPPLFWVAMHRMHHAHSDGEGDPHSPLCAGGKLRRLRALIHAHVGWMLAPMDIPNYARLIPDLLRDADVVRIGKWYICWVVAGILIPGVLISATTGTWRGGVEGLLWAGLLRICLVHHAT